MKNLKKLNVGKLSLDELRQVGTVLSAKEQEAFVGGTTTNSIDLGGGINAVSYDTGSDKYTVVYLPNGYSMFFDGVVVGHDSAWNGASYQFNGIINEGNGLDMNTFIHEYGHYLQQVDMNTLNYLLSVGLGSAYESIRQELRNRGVNISGTYYGSGYEHDASVRGNGYMDQYYPNSGYSAPTR